MNLIMQKPVLNLKLFYHEKTTTQHPFDICTL